MNNVKTNEKGAVQGDVPIIRVESLTKGGKPTDQRVVAVGEATGHNHIILGEVECFEVRRNFGNALFNGLEVVVTKGSPATIEHTSGGEHNTIEMTPGVYFIPLDGQQVEYDGENERRAID